MSAAESVTRQDRTRLPGETMMWGQALALAYLDAVDAKNRPMHGRAYRDGYDMEWLHHHTSGGKPSKWFVMICDFCGVCADRLAQETAKAIYNNDTAALRAIGKGLDKRFRRGQINGYKRGRERKGRKKDFTA